MDTILELSTPTTSPALLYHTLWKQRETISYEMFILRFQLRRANKLNYPLLALIIEKECELTKIKYIKDILAWQTILFETFPKGSLTRIEVCLRFKLNVIFLHTILFIQLFLIVLF